jgi:acetyl esterase/lipase
MENEMRKALALLIFVVLLHGTAPAQRHHHDHSETPAAAPCFDPGDRNDIRLWDGTAPGATGSDPCRDIPFLRMFPAAGGQSAASPAIIVMPGGGYDRLSDAKEQTPVGEYFSHQLHAVTFVLYYRLVQTDGTYRYPVPMWDGQRALKLVRYRARQWGVDPNRVMIFGFSAGGHLASTLALHSASDFDLPVHDAVDSTNARPDLLGLGYPVISMDPEQYAAKSSHDHLLYGYRGKELDHLQRYLSGQDNVTPHTPPVFLFESMDDARISPLNSVLFAQALHAGNVPVEAKFFQHGVHGAGLATGIPEESAWPELFQQWLEGQHFLR